MCTFNDGIEVPLWRQDEPRLRQQRRLRLRRAVYLSPELDWDDLDARGPYVRDRKTVSSDQRFGT